MDMGTNLTTEQIQSDEAIDFAGAHLSLSSTITIKKNMKKILLILFSLSATLHFLAAQQIPSAVDQKIRSIYAEKYPDNFSMQKTLIESQFKSYRRLVSWKNEKGIPPSVFSKVRDIYDRKYPDNYSMQQTLVESQFEAYTFMDSYNSADGIPTDIFIRIKKKYEQKYPFNYSMQKTLVQSQVESYIELNQ